MGIRPQIAMNRLLKTLLIRCLGSLLISMAHHVYTVKMAVFPDLYCRKLIVTVKSWGFVQTCANLDMVKQESSP